VAHPYAEDGASSLSLFMFAWHHLDQRGGVRPHLHAGFLSLPLYALLQAAVLFSECRVRPA
jgi:hypothetical protein